MHPFIGDLSTLTDTEILDKINEINNKISSSYRLGYIGMMGQLQLALTNYMEEKSRRDAKKMEALASKSTDYDKIIKVGK